MNLTEKTRLIQQWAGVNADGAYGPATADAIMVKAGIERAAKPFDRQTFLRRHINLKAAAITPLDIDRAALLLRVTPAHIRAVMTVESRGGGFDPKGRPTILFEPHVFHRRTNGQFSPSPYSYAKWRDRPYPTTMDGRWSQMADAASMDEAAALESASWGLFQIMGFHWKALGYESAQAFSAAMTASEGNHLDALVRFIKANALADELGACKPGNAESCRAFAAGYNGSGYAANGYHTKLAAALK